MIFDSWTTFGVAWSIAGAATLAVTDAAMRHEEGEGIFEQCRGLEDTVVNVLASLVVFLFWPAVWIFVAVLAVRPDLDLGLKAPLRRAPQRKPRLRMPMPRLDTPWWKPAEHEAEIICRMVRLRLKKDPRLSGEAPPWRWPTERLLVSTEALLLELVRGYLVLRMDGLTPPEIVEKLENARTDPSGSPPDARLRPYLKWRLTLADPGYLALGRRVFGPALAVAVRWVRSNQRTGDAPPGDWLGAPVPPEEIEAGFEGFFFPTGPRPENWRDALVWKRRDWSAMKLRLEEGDAIAQFCRPASEDGKAGGRYGIALVRDGAAVAWIDAAATVEDNTGYPE